MYFLIFIPALIIFLYCIYKLMKDDYVFIRKNISAEQMFDITFLLMWVGLLFSRFFFLLFHAGSNNLFLSFFSPRVGGFSLYGLLIGGIVTLYLVGKYKKLPMGRLFDFFALACSASLPVGLLFSLIFLRGQQLLIGAGNVLAYVLFVVLFIKLSYSKLMVREVKEGRLFISFVMFFSFISLINTIFLQQIGKITLISGDSIMLLLLLLFCVVLLIKNKQPGKKKV